MDIVVVSVDRSRPDVVIANTSVDLLHCRITMPKAALAKLGYKAYRPKLLRPVIDALIARQIARHNGVLPLGGIVLDENDLEDLPVAPPA
ncbi:MAG: hypothetical protein C7B44_01370 [Sulfobacillus thermosulfidooxidans]|uniref:Uncharacterized protein n=1 Tax=Sulfobacillus thermotolerans TaxID=338644 RepID=A0ABM6RUZ4_9FIRM|nr:hypothetical protein [Sulfobacillus sp. hq2]AUW95017.1 hypothetical protein BXT84_14510 [Sulfobacillus thermotolerans]MCY0909318.1 hypothetical protein [Sulfobacillus thermotolerans]POB10381.1 hypothetical protein CO251_10575 [Sulfobacillus sp. hq2]PSR37903.1 MAG: hypothetical protein C7B44_01370 [Sulfobacillus thermosulfidooxidans]